MFHTFLNSILDRVKQVSSLPLYRRQREPLTYPLLVKVRGLRIGLTWSMDWKRNITTSTANPFST
jgi:hypothetical protein